MAIYNVMLYEMITNKIIKINVQRTKCQFVQMVFATFSGFFQLLPVFTSFCHWQGKN